MHKKIFTVVVILITLSLAGIVPAGRSIEKVSVDADSGDWYGRAPNQGQVTVDNWELIIKDPADDLITWHSPDNIWSSNSSNDIIEFRMANDPWDLYIMAKFKDIVPGETWAPLIMIAFDLDANNETGNEWFPYYADVKVDSTRTRWEKVIKITRESSDDKGNITVVSTDWSDVYIGSYCDFRISADTDTLEARIPLYYLGYPTGTTIVTIAVFNAYYGEPRDMTTTPNGVDCLDIVGHDEAGDSTDELFQTPGDQIIDGEYSFVYDFDPDDGGLILMTGDEWYYDLSYNTYVESIAAGSYAGTLPRIALVGGYKNTTSFSAFLRVYHITTTSNRPYLDAETTWTDVNNAYAYGVASADVDNDGKEEILVAGWRGNDTTKGHLLELRIYSMPNTSTLSLEYDALWAVPDDYNAGRDTEGWDVAAANLDGDAYLEIAVVGFRNGSTDTKFGVLRIAQWDGSTFTWEASTDWQTVSGYDTHAFGVAIADVDGDSTKEIVVVGFHGSASGLYAEVSVFNYVSGTLTRENTYSWQLVSGYNAKCEAVAVDDVDDDGDIEIVAVGIANDGTRDNAFILVLSYDGTSFTKEVSRPWYTTSGTGAFDVNICDIDDDDTREIVTVNNYFDGTKDHAVIRVWQWTRNVFADGNEA